MKTTTIKTKITKGDLRKALGQPWSTTTCVIAQTLMRVKKVRRIFGLDSYIARIRSNGKPIHHNAGNAQNVFDRAFQGDSRFSKSKKFSELKGLIGTPVVFSTDPKEVA